MNFSSALLKEIFSNFSNNLENNWDHLRFGQKDPSIRKGIRNLIQKRLNKKGYYHKTTIEYVIRNSLQINKFQFLYDNLVYDNDRELLLKVLAFRVLGHRRVKLPLNTPQYWDSINLLEGLIDKSDFIKSDFMDIVLYKINLNKINYPIVFYYSIGGVLADFVVKQYEYRNNGTIIKAEKGDIVIDGGGCWGDTSLYFSNEVGSDGKVFSFEFIPNNISLFEKNISLNENLKKNIELVKNPMWANSTTKVYFKDYGPGSKVSMQTFEDMEGTCLTKSIDDLVSEKNLNKVDFIKMDIEGSELSALQGAEKTISRFKPKLAIALYHSPEDFEDIPKLIRQIDPKYKFYFSHSSIHQEESMLFAKVD